VVLLSTLRSHTRYYDYGEGYREFLATAAGVVVSKEIARFLEEYRWWHAVTFSSHPVVMAAVCENIKFMMEEDLPGRAAKMGDYLGRRLMS
jgi:taurine--2-oxoglutarate transaminase